jgi:hypothetical protein
LIGSIFVVFIKLIFFIDNGFFYFGAWSLPFCSIIVYWVEISVNVIVIICAPLSRNLEVLRICLHHFVLVKRVSSHSLCSVQFTAVNTIVRTRVLRFAKPAAVVSSPVPNVYWIFGPQIVIQFITSAIVW